MNRTLAASALSLVFFLVGGLWLGLLRFLPAGPPRYAAVITIGLVFNAVFVALLIRRVRSVLGGEGRIWMQVGIVLLEVALLVAGFAAMYAQIGIMDTTQQGSPVIHNFWTAAYLSVVTFTTLGYGDIYPTGLGRALAAMQAFTGYVILGLLASSVASVVSPHSPAGPQEEDEEE